VKTIEIRRHSKRYNHDQNLSPEGIELAKKIGSQIGSFDIVATSPLARAIQTASAMGFKVDQVVEEFSTYGDDVDKEVKLDSNFFEVSKVVAKGKNASLFSKKVSLALDKIAKQLKDDGSALVISHGGVIELGVVGCLPNYNFKKLGKYIGNCEGVRLFHDGEKFVDAEVLRL